MLSDKLDAVSRMLALRSIGGGNLDPFLQNAMVQLSLFTVSTIIFVLAALLLCQLRPVIFQQCCSIWLGNET